MLDTSDMLKLADAITPRLRCLVLLGGFVALRPSELLGLQRRDIDVLHRTVTVGRQAHEITGQERVITEPKSEAGRRTLGTSHGRSRCVGRSSQGFRGSRIDRACVHPSVKATAATFGSVE